MGIKESYEEREREKKKDRNEEGGAGFLYRDLVVLSRLLITKQNTRTENGNVWWLRRLYGE